MCLQYPSEEKKTHLHTEKYAETSVDSNKSSSNFKQRSPILLNCQEVGKNMDYELGGSKKTDVDEKRYDAASNYIPVK